MHYDSMSATTTGACESLRLGFSPIVALACVRAYTFLPQAESKMRGFCFYPAKKAAGGSVTNTILWAVFLWFTWNTRVASLLMRTHPWILNSIRARRGHRT